MRCHHTVDIPATTGKKKRVCPKRQGVNWGVGGGGCLEEKREGVESGSFLRFTETIPILITNSFHLQSTFRTDTPLMQTAAASVSIMFY